MRNHTHTQRNSRSLWSFLFLTALIGLILSGCATTPTRVYRIGILSGLDFIADVSDGFKLGMAELGYVEGQNVVYDIQKTNFDLEAYRRVLKQFVADNVDLIVVFPTEASLEAKKATEGTNIPVIFTFALIEGVPLIDNVREPGGNITGVRYPGTDIALKRFEIMRMIAPEARRFWLPYQAGYPTIASQIEILRPAAAAAGVTLIEAPFANSAELEADLQERTAAADLGIDAILILVEPLAVVPDAFGAMAMFAAAHKLPIGGALNSVDGYGSIFGVNVKSFDAGRQAAPLADKVLKGTPAGSIPVVSSESFLQIDYNTALNLGVSVPEGLLRQADDVIR